MKTVLITGDYRLIETLLFTLLLKKNFQVIITDQKKKKILDNE